MNRNILKNDRLWFVVLASFVVYKFLFEKVPSHLAPKVLLLHLVQNLCLMIGLIGFGVRVLRSQASGRGKWIFVLVIGAVAGFSLLVIPLTGAPPRPAQSSPPADRAKVVNELVESFKPLRESLREVDAAQARAYYASGRAEQAAGDATAAEEYFDRAIKLNPNYTEAYYGRGNVRAAKGNSDGAIADYSRAIELDPRQAMPYDLRGVERLKKGDSDGALADFNHAIELDPAKPFGYEFRGDLEFKKKQYALGIKDEEKAIELDPKNGDYYMNLGWHQLFNRQPREAIAASLRALQLSPNNALMIKVNLAHGYLFNNQFQKAKAIYLENKDAEIRDVKRTFGQAALDDFKELQEAGVTHPDMDKIKTQLTKKSQEKSKIARRK
ncbi:MAG: tetratricopeptide repeat protein [Verrucomicrobia bacterium]|nr:tetratricopeptide repeat protein [Verrucomicrobiota bacterium]